MIISLGLSDLIGSSVLKPYMHGFLMKASLYHKSQQVLDNNNTEKPAADSKDDDIDEKDAEALVEKNLIEADRIPQKEAQQVAAKAHKAGVKSRKRQLEEISDDRFTSMLQQDPEFQVNPKKKQKLSTERQALRKPEQQGFEKVEQEKEQQGNVNMYELQAGKTISYAREKVSNVDNKRKSFENRIKAASNKKNPAAGIMEMEAGGKQVSFDSAKAKNKQDELLQKDVDDTPKRRSANAFLKRTKVKGGYSKR